MKNLKTLFLLVLFLSPTPFVYAQSPDTWFAVRKVVDGDSLLLKGPSYRPIRLIGIDTPETHANEKLTRDSQRSHQDEKTLIKMGKKSREITKKLVEKRPVRLEFDETTVDKYGRKLAYVYFRMREDQFAKIMKFRFDKSQKPREKEYLLNEELLRYGWAQTFRSFSFRLKPEFLALEREARENGRGLWKNIEIEKASKK